MRCIFLYGATGSTAASLTVGTKQDEFLSRTSFPPLNPLRMSFHLSASREPSEGLVVSCSRFPVRRRNKCCNKDRYKTKGIFSLIVERFYFHFIQFYRFEPAYRMILNDNLFFTHMILPIMSVCELFVQERFHFLAVSTSVSV